MPYAVNASALSDSCGMLIQMCACPSCHGHHHGEGEEESETDALLRRREKLLTDLQRIETELEDLRSG